jgi:hypothetical protein
MTKDEQTKPRFEIVSETTTPETGANVFDDLETLAKVSAITVQRKAVLVNVAVGRPDNNVHFRAHPTWYLDDQTIIKDPTSGVHYYVTPAMRTHEKLAKRLRKVTLAVIALWPADTVMIWPVPVLGATKKDFKAWKSARAAYDLSQTKWVQIVWSEELSDYSVETAEGINHEPNWPADKTFNDLLKLGFADRIIDSEDHDYVRQLRGITD